MMGFGRRLVGSSTQLARCFATSSSCTSKEVSSFSTTTTGDMRTRDFVTSSSRSSKAAPSFSTAGNTKTGVTYLRLGHALSLVCFGKPNIRPISRYQSIEEFSELAVRAVEGVTKSVSVGDFASLGGLVSEECISKLKELNICDLGESERKLVAVNKNDIFFHIVDQSNLTFSKVLFVTFSFPELEKCRLLQKELDKNNQELVKHKYKKAIEKLMERNEILVGNYMFIKNKDSHWVISEISHFNTVDLWPDNAKKNWLMILDYQVKTGQPFSTSFRNMCGNLLVRKEIVKNLIKAKLHEIIGLFIIVYIINLLALNLRDSENK